MRWYPANKMSLVLVQATYLSEATSLTIYADTNSSRGFENQINTMCRCKTRAEANPVQSIRCDGFYFEFWIWIRNSKTFQFKYFEFRMSINFNFWNSNADCKEIVDSHLISDTYSNRNVNFFLSINCNYSLV